MVVVVMLGAVRRGLQVHAALGAFAWPLLAHFRMHGTGVFNRLRGRRWCCGTMRIMSTVHTRIVVMMKMGLRSTLRR
jgi:hypothetical protein